MRTVVLLDKLIDKDEALELLEDYGAFIKEHTDIDCTWWLERHDFSAVPTVPDADGDLKPTDEYRQSLTKDVHNRYGDYGCDHVIMWVHEDNFLFKGYWGIAWGYVHFKYMLELCRWDKDNSVNTWNTIFHENGGHPHDRLILKELGIDINPLIASHFGYSSFNYDEDYVHGKHPDWQYIGRKGYQRDGRMLKFLAPYLKQAYARRKAKHEERVGMLKQIVSLLSTLVGLLSKKK
jgi:hypothetical protein